jgi:hypothetical protein
MGYTSVAVLHNDMIAEIARDGGEIGKRMSWAMRNWDPVSLEGYFQVGRVIAQGHASAHQVVVVYGNTGCHISKADGVSYLALSDMADCLRRHGWSAKPPKKSKPSPPVLPVTSGDPAPTSDETPPSPGDAGGADLCPGCGMPIHDVKSCDAVHCGVWGRL